MESISRTDGPYVFFQGKRCLDFSSCDFLGLSQHPDVKRGTIRYILKHGVGVFTAPLKTTIQEQLEEKLAHALKVNQVLIFSSLDRLIEVLNRQQLLGVSLKNGGAVSGRGGIFMDASLMIGVSGETGFEVLHQCEQKVDFIIGSLTFGAGCNGAFIASNRDLNRMGILGDSIDFPSLGALNSAFDLIPQMKEEREKVRYHCDCLSRELLNWVRLAETASPRLELYLKSEEEARLLWEACVESDIFLFPPESNVVFLAVTALHSVEDLDQLLKVLKKLFVSGGGLSKTLLTSIS